MPIDDNCGPGEAGAASDASEAFALQPTQEAAGTSNSGADSPQNVPVQVVKPIQYHMEGGSGGPSSPVQGSSESEFQQAMGMSDEDAFLNMQRQQEEIDKEQKEQPLVTPKLPMRDLVMRYDDGSQFFRKASDLAEKYKQIQFIRRDGNCFYRAVLSAVLDVMQNDSVLFNQFCGHCNGWLNRIIALGYTEFTASDICEFFTDAINAVKDGKRDISSLIDDLTNDGSSNYYVSFLRLISAGFLREKEDDYKPFLTEYETMKDFCEHEVEPMWKEADHLAIVGLAHALRIPIRVEYLDQNAAPDGQSHYDFTVDGVDDGQPPSVTVLFTPGHYDVLYKK